MADLVLSNARIVSRHDVRDGSIAVQNGVIAAIDPNGPMQGLETPYAVGGALVGIVFMVINLGAIAILISLHDRHKEIASGVHRIADAIEQHKA